jgi:hypothetical protein
VTDERIEALIREHFFGDLPENLDAMARNFAVAVLENKSLGVLYGAIRCLACGQGPVERVFLDGVECSRCEACGIELVNGRQHDASLFRVMRDKLSLQGAELERLRQAAQVSSGSTAERSSGEKTPALG